MRNEATVTIAKLLNQFDSFERRHEVVKFLLVISFERSRGFSIVLYLRECGFGVSRN